MSSPMVRWRIRGANNSLGYFHEGRHVPVPGDTVRMLPGEPDSFVVRVDHREFEQPERDRARITIYADVVPEAEVAVREETYR